MSSLAYHFATTDSWRRPLLSFREFCCSVCFNFFLFWTSTRDFLLFLFTYQILNAFSCTLWASYLGRDNAHANRRSLLQLKSVRIFSTSTFHHFSLSNRFWGFDYIPPIFQYIHFAPPRLLWWIFFLLWHTSNRIFHLDALARHFVDASSLQNNTGQLLLWLSSTFCFRFTIFSFNLFFFLFSLGNFLFIFSSFFFHPALFSLLFLAAFKFYFFIQRLFALKNGGFLIIKNWTFALSDGKFQHTIGNFSIAFHFFIHFHRTFFSFFLSVVLFGNKSKFTLNKGGRRVRKLTNKSKKFLQNFGLGKRGLDSAGLRSRSSVDRNQRIR